MTLDTFYTSIGDLPEYTINTRSCIRTYTGHDRWLYKRFTQLCEVSQNTPKIHGRVFWHIPVTTDDFINVPRNYWGSGRPTSVFWYVDHGRALPTVRIIVPSSRMVSVQPTTIAQSISEQYMVVLHSPIGRDTIFVYLADYANTLSPTWNTLYNNTNPSGFSHIHTRKVLLPHS